MHIITACMAASTLSTVQAALNQLYYYYCTILKYYTVIATACMQAYLQCCNDILLSITVIPITWSDVAIEEEWLQFGQLFA